MGRTVTRKALELHREIDEALHLIVVVVFPFEIGGPVQRPWQRPRVGRMVRHHLAEAIHVPIAHLQDAAGIAQNGARLQFTESDDLSDVIVAVFLLDITDHLAPPRFAEVDIEVGHRNAFGVEKTFKQQTELDRIEIRDGQSPCNEATRTRTTARTYRNIMVLGPFYEVGNDQEVARKAHLIDDIDFELQAIEINLSLVFGHLAIRFETRFQTPVGIFRQHARLAFEVTCKAGQDRLPVWRSIGTALRHDERVLNSLRQIVESLVHHVIGFYIAFRVRLRPLVGVDMRGSGNAQHGIMRLMHVRLCKICRVCGDEREVTVVGQLDQRCLCPLFHLVTTASQLDVKPFGKQLLKFLQQDLCMALLSLGQKLRQRALACPAECYEPTGVAIKIGQADMGFELERAFQMGAADEMAEIVVPLLVLRVEWQVVDLLAFAIPRNTKKGPDDRLDALRLAGVREHDCAVKAVAIGNGDSGKAAFLGQFGHRLRVNRTLQHGVGGEDAERDEGLERHALQYAYCTRDSPVTSALTSPQLTERSEELLDILCNRLGCVGRGISFHHIALSVDQELGKIPFDCLRPHETGFFGLHPVEQGARVVAIHVDFLHEGKGQPEVHFTEFCNFTRVARFLSTKLVARKGKHFETLLPVLLK